MSIPATTKGCAGEGEGHDPGVLPVEVVAVVPLRLGEAELLVEAYGGFVADTHLEVALRRLVCGCALLHALEHEGLGDAAAPVLLACGYGDDVHEARGA